MDIIEIKRADLQSQGDLVKALKDNELTLTATSLDQFWHEMQKDNNNLMIGLDCSQHFIYCNIVLVPATSTNYEIENSLDTLFKLDYDKARQHWGFVLNSF